MVSDDAKKLMEIFSKRLRIVMQENNITQTYLASTLGVSESTVGKWLLKKALPRMGIIEKISIIFGRPKSYFLEEEEERATYYLNPKAAEMAQEIADNPELGMLFDAARGVSPEDLKAVADMVRRFKKVPDDDNQDPEK